MRTKLSLHYFMSNLTFNQKHLVCSEHTLQRNILALNRFWYIILLSLVSSSIKGLRSWHSGRSTIQYPEMVGLSPPVCMAHCASLSVVSLAVSFSSSLKSDRTMDCVNHGKCKGCQADVLVVDKWQANIL